MKPFNTRARWYEQLTLDEASEIETLDIIILAAKKAMERRAVIQKRALARVQHVTRKSRRLANLDAIQARRPKDEADAAALVTRLKRGAGHSGPAMAGESVIENVISQAGKKVIADMRRVAGISWEDAEK